jgi:hypothetical protein
MGAVRLSPPALAASACIALGVLAVSSEARAYCRTTTGHAPLGYDPAVSGCWTQGKALGWPAGRIPYGVSSAGSQYVTPSEATRVADLAFAAWNDVVCANGPPDVQAYDVGLLMQPDASDCATSAMCDPAAHDIIVFRDAAWPYDDPVNTLALTTVSYGVNDGVIFEAIVEVNTAQHAVTAVEPLPDAAPAGAFDLQAILTHEAGHFFGLAHATDTQAVMYAYYQSGAITLTPDDVAGMCAMYGPPPPGQASSGCATSRAERESSWVGMCACVLIAVVWRRTRPSRRRSG